MRKHWSTIVLIIVFLLGLSLLLYPTVSDYINSLHQSRAISVYNQKIAKLSQKDYDAMWKAAQKYNETLFRKGGEPRNLTLKEQSVYNKLLNPTGTGMMGYIEIPSIHVKLPIYHGTSDPVLQVGVGHVTGTSLPVGGKTTHCVLSGHRGLPSAKLFTDLDKMSKGSIFSLHILNRVLVYQVDQIRIVDPDDLTDLMIEKDKDYCTLLTCTPYGVNTQRLLVRGVPTSVSEKLIVEADALQVDPMIVATCVAVPIVILFLIFILVKAKRQKRRLK